MPEKEAGRYGDQAFTQMMYAKVVTVQLINRLGYDVLFQDVDLGECACDMFILSCKSRCASHRTCISLPIVWYRNPLEFFHDKRNPLYAFDMLCKYIGSLTVIPHAL